MRDVYEEASPWPNLAPEPFPVNAKDPHKIPVLKKSPCQTQSPSKALRCLPAQHTGSRQSREDWAQLVTYKTQGACMQGLNLKLDRARQTCVPHNGYGSQLTLSQTTWHTPYQREHCAADLGV